jgi:hypothetical protein
MMADLQQIRIDREDCETREDYVSWATAYGDTLLALLPVNDTKERMSEERLALERLKSAVCNLMPQWYCESHTCEPCEGITESCVVADECATIRATLTAYEESLREADRLADEFSRLWETVNVAAGRPSGVHNKTLAAYRLTRSTHPDTPTEEGR